MSPENTQAPEVDDLIDRIAIWPGQLTAHDSGGLEIMALRRLAETELGDRFDVREFHTKVLETGMIPLGALRRHMEAWIAEKRSANARVTLGLQ